METKLSDWKPSAVKSQGFWSLKFEPALEQEYLQTQADIYKNQLRASLIIACVLMLAIPAASQLASNGAGFGNSAIFLARSVLLLPILALMLWTSFTGNSASSLARLGLIGAFVAGPISILVSVLFDMAGWRSPDLGYVMVVFYIYFFLGLRFYPATAIALTLLVSYVCYGLLSPVPPTFFYKQAILLGFATMMGSASLYNLERAQRNGFLHAKELKYLASKDPLTGLANRKTFSEHLERMWAHCQRRETPLAVALFDIDHFKAYNDTYGHQHGDRCLARVADVLAAAFRKPLDLTARYGGEEFIVVLPEIGVAEGLRRVEAVRAMLDRVGLEHGASPTAPLVTISAGLAVVKPHTSKRSAAGLLQAADEALYQAKTLGRDQVFAAKTSETELSTTGVVDIQNRIKEMHQKQR